MATRDIVEAVGVFLLAGISAVAAGVLVEEALERRRRRQESDFDCWNCNYPVIEGEHTCPSCGVEFDWQPTSPLVGT